MDKHRGFTLCQHLCINERWIVDSVSDQLRDVNDERFAVALSPVAGRLLYIMMRNPNVVMRRQMLMDDGWRRFGFEVGENSLNQVICELRSAFERLPAAKPSIKTIPRIGYCLLADVGPVETTISLTEPRNLADLNWIPNQGSSVRLM
ncbi:MULTISPECIES: winged helix-turn-helix domain-containing protein [unclassified Caballeronia]|uniref:winged helix-turn-helix domain-containing protein n=1 Tax=unclassified Caballeronia TaxID=2646786 RepID=UPI002028C979|nr:MULTISPECIES: winged helix-turn-helix domain-containing protein [unclassified Caballeronia]